MEPSPESSWNVCRPGGQSKQPFITLKREQMYCMCLCFLERDVSTGVVMRDYIKM